MDTTTEAAAERVRAFLAERTRAHRDGELIYALGGLDGIVELRHDDLEALVRAVAPEADLGVEDPRVAAGRRGAARALARALQDDSWRGREAAALTETGDENREP